MKINLETEFEFLLGLYCDFSQFSEIFVYNNMYFHRK